MGFPKSQPFNLSLNLTDIGSLGENIRARLHHVHKILDMSIQLKE